MCIREHNRHSVLSVIGRSSISKVSAVKTHTASNAKFDSEADDDSIIFSDSNITTADILTEYFGPGPAVNSGPHRYTFVLLRQPGLLSIAELTGFDVEELANFDVGAFAEENGLEAVSVQYFVAENRGEVTQA